MATKKDYVVGSGNVFADLGYARPEEAATKDLEEVGGFSLREFSFTCCVSSGFPRQVGGPRQQVEGVPCSRPVVERLRTGREIQKVDSSVSRGGLGRRQGRAHSLPEEIKLINGLTSEAVGAPLFGLEHEPHVS
jgi:hypothetical protein